jgi:hypothetical protein
MSIIVWISAMVLAGAQQTPPPVTDLPPVDAPSGAAQADAPAPEGAEPDPMDRVTCRSEPVVGSRFNSRVCMTRREWARRREESQRLAHRLEAQNSNRGRIYAPRQGGAE